jgi:hypothetical protein
VSIVRAPATAPFMTLPLQGFLLAAATDYILPAGSVWIARIELRQARADHAGRGA